MDIYSVYWVRKPEHNDPYNEGYIGISNNVDRRIQEHKRVTNTIIYNALNYNQVIIDILHTNINKKEAILLETEYRPSERIGWNICPGGGMPPSNKGKPSKLKGKKWTDEQKENLKLIRKQNPRVCSEETRKKLSIANKGKPNNRLGTKQKIVICPHCNKKGGINGMIQWHFDKCKHRRS